jgi:aerobic-type carbon monoxide dehydrogenase small subunit (CoxS/CutS family)
MADNLTINVNGKAWAVEASSDTPLLYVLANELGLKGPRFGCGLAQCGSCSVLADGVEIRSCITPVSNVAGKSVTTLEGLPALYAQQKGLAQAPALHPLQQAFIDEQAPHCGYCYNGMLIKGSELLARSPRPSEAEIRAHMNGHLCRCGTYQRITSAIQLASTRIAGGSQ